MSHYDPMKPTGPSRQEPLYPNNPMSPPPLPHQQPMPGDPWYKSPYPDKQPDAPNTPYPKRPGKRW